MNKKNKQIVFAIVGFLVGWILVFLTGCHCHGYHAAAYHDACKAALHAPYIAGKNK